ncbi:hypothetical protein D3C80_1044730 [compost metagenome]
MVAHGQLDAAVLRALQHQFHPAFAMGWLALADGQAELALQAGQRPFQALRLLVVVRGGPQGLRQRMGLAVPFELFQHADLPPARLAMGAALVDGERALRFVLLLQLLGDAKQQPGVAGLQVGVA